MDVHMSKSFRFAKDFLLCVFTYYGQVTADIYNSCKRLFHKENYYLLSDWGVHIIKNELEANGRKIRSDTEHFTGRREANDRTFDEVARTLLLWRQQFTDPYGGLYVNCLYLSDLALLFHSRGHERAPMLAIELMVNFPRIAWDACIIDEYEDVLRAISIRLVDYVFLHEEFVMPREGLCDLPIPEMYRRVWIEVREAADEFLFNEGALVLKLFRMAHDKIQFERFYGLVNEIASVIPSLGYNRKAIYKALSKIALLALHCHSIENPIFTASKKSIDVITKAFIECRRRRQLTD